MLPGKLAAFGITGPDVGRLQRQVRDAIIGLTRQEVVAFAHEVLDSAETPRLSVQIRSANNNDPAPAGAYTDVQQFRHRPAATTLAAPAHR